MAFKRLIRDAVFVIISINLIRTGSVEFLIYGLIILFFTIYFYISSN